MLAHTSVLLHIMFFVLLTISMGSGILAYLESADSGRMEVKSVLTATFFGSLFIALAIAILGN